MIFSKPLEFVDLFVTDLDEAIKEHNPAQGLSSTQRRWLCFCIMGILVTHSVCWARFERASLGNYSVAALSWMLRHSKIPWEMLLVVSVRLILHRYGITEGILAADDSDKKRSKSTRKIYKVFKLKDKTSGGFIMGQCLVFLVLVTEKITFPVGFAFYKPDPELSKWNKLNEKLKKAGIPAEQRPSKPKRDKDYPTKQQIALDLLKQFQQDHPQIKVRCILADALYGDKNFMDKASALFGRVQVISQLRYNQNVWFRGKKISVKEFFSRYRGTAQTISIRGGQSVNVVMGSARLRVDSHGKKRFVIALQYEGEEQYRYIVASDLSWRTQDIVEAYTFRWLAEVFFEDWKSCEGWANLAKQQGEEGSNRGLILSLLLDHCLLLHHEQLARIENNLPAYTVGSLQNRAKVDALLAFIRDLVSSEDPTETLDQLSERIKDVFELQLSKKHMVGRDLGRLEPTPSLKYKAKAAMMG